MMVVGILFNIAGIGYLSNQVQSLIVLLERLPLGLLVLGDVPRNPKHVFLILLFLVLICSLVAH